MSNYIMSLLFPLFEEDFSSCFNFIAFSLFSSFFQYFLILFQQVLLRQTKIKKVLETTPPLSICYGDL